MGRYDGALDDPWRVHDADFPSSGMPEEQLRFFLNYAVLAPSSHNTQPWLFRLNGEEVALLADRRRALPVSDPDDRELIISCGAALFNLRVAMEYFGRRPSVRTFPDLTNPDLLAFVRSAGMTERTAEVDRLFRAIQRRRTVWTPFDERPVETSLCDLLCESAGKEGLSIRIFSQSDEKIALSDLIAEGERDQGLSRSFRRELAAWMHPNRSHSRDGIPGLGTVMADVLSHAGPLIIRTFDRGRGKAAVDRELADGSPILVVLSTTTDHSAAWLDVGQGLSRVLLEAASHGVYASFLNQPIETPALRPRVAELTGHGFPQLILRMGYGAGGRPTPRRSVMEVLDRP